MNLMNKHAVSQDLSELVTELVTEFQKFDGPDERAITREFFTCAVSVQFMTPDKCYQAFARDISELGIGLIMDKSMDNDAAATLSIERFDGNTIKLRARCRWCRPYGTKWFLTGWEFTRLIGIRRF